ncbi:DUF4249 family protein [Bizionia gelidisalsuginis]|uniref:DUF4249 family protein n=1 Tax=Bizionia gelidisalsuginis TaxID=291188 RepID=A0ABY3M9R3_9FLAO|nr:DUF4249 family protein [Bizionia gelidisalsuginis]
MKIVEENTSVVITDNQGNTYNFIQNNIGAYVFNVAFEALPNTMYTLSIKTSDGKQYISSKTELAPLSQIDDLYAEVISGGRDANKV